MAISTEHTYLIVKDTSTSSSTWKKLIDVKEVPDLGKAPSNIDTTTLSDSMKTGIPGLLDPGALEFTANYTKKDYDALKAYVGKICKYGVQFGKTGENGVQVFDGELSCWIKGGGVEDVLEIGISIVASTEITDGETNDKATIN